MNDLGMTAPPELVKRTEDAIATMRTGLDAMQRALDEAWEWYEATLDETRSIVDVNLKDEAPL